ncbi:hypothetical protein [Streptomyces sp. WAC01280]|uniref:hypothetical protein n=1 Tax=Streptomyces sp. WAC01280 TaxID=2487424 RepID=UPI000F7A5B29|nr:hypothetical protein [Streptomyces sp. WAC01280]RSS57440.1 hypothetical protein EF909_15950 [Streptomyces sp. WAC01280]
MPLVGATVRWEEAERAAVRVARRTLHQRDAEADGQEADGENLAFNPWRSLPEYRPAGSLT